jgi:dephospho-CoA kinase
MLKLKRIAITGGVASGKTTVCSLFQKLGAYVVSADAIAHQLLDPRTELGQTLLKIFGSDLLQDGHIDRKALGKKVFNDPERLQQLEQLLHPSILAEIERRYEEACQGSYTLFVAEIPLLFEIGNESHYDATVAVISTRARERFIAAGHTLEEYEARMAFQLSPAEKAARADHILENNSLNILERDVQKLNHILIR